MAGKMRTRAPMKMTPQAGLDSRIPIGFLHSERTFPFGTPEAFGVAERVKKEFQVFQDGLPIRE
jgi:hypothetical protein